MITGDLQQMSNHRLCKAAISWSWAMQSHITPGRGRAAVEISVIAVVSGKI
jgi:hypothetical protein